MSKIYTAVCVIASAFLLASCATFKKEEQVRVEYVKPYIPGELLIDIEIPKPSITPEEYIKLPYNKREKFLFDMNVELYKVLKDTNIRLTTLRSILTDKENEVKK